jgi:hypothetical protein
VHKHALLAALHCIQLALKAFRAQIISWFAISRLGPAPATDRFLARARQAISGLVGDLPVQPRSKKYFCFSEPQIRTI